MDARDEQGLEFADAAQWEAWLADHDTEQAGVWMLIAKNGSGATTVTQPEALDGALCFGWIDAQRKGHDERHYRQRYCPRRPRSTWSQVNVDKAEALIAAGRMRGPGFAAIEAAKADGRWAAAYQPQRDVTVPDDLAAVLAADDRLRARFDRQPKTERYAQLLGLMTARTPKTRAARLDRILASLDG